MDEKRLYDILGQNVEVPDMVNKKLEQTYGLITQKKRPVKRRGFRPVRTVLVAAVLIAALCVTATAAYQLFRQDVAVEKPTLVQGILGGGGIAWEEKTDYDQMGRLSYWPRRELTPVDEEQAMKLLGDYLPESGYQWQIEDFTFTVEGYVLDEHTSTGRIYYTIERPGGFPEGVVDWEHGMLDFTKVDFDLPIFEPQTEVKWHWFGSRQYVDVTRSTAEKLVIVEALANPLAASDVGWKAADGLCAKFYDGKRVMANLELPGVQSLPAVTVKNPETGETVVTFSAIGMMLDTQYLRSYLPNGDEVHDTVKYLALEYVDGTSYVVWDDGLDNADYACSDEKSTLHHICYNRLVDPVQVTAVVVDGQRYEVG